MTQSREHAPVPARMSTPPQPVVRSGVRRIVRNVASLLTSDVVNRATTFVLYLLVARYLGAYAFGQMSLALALFHTFGVIAAAGLKTLITREVTRDPAQTDPYIVNACAVVMGSSLLSVAGLLVFVRLMDYAPDTAATITLMALGLLPYALSVISEAVFQAWERMHFIAYVNTFVNLARLGITLGLLSQGCGLYPLIALIVVSQVAVAGIEWWLMVRYIVRPRARLQPRLALTMVRSTSTFLAIDGVLAVRSNLNLVLLSKLATETEVGLYNAAFQLTIPLMMIFESIALSVFPIMCRSYDANLSRLKAVCESTVEILLAVALPVVIALSFLADMALSLLYGEGDFLQAVPALQIIAWVMVTRAVTQVLGRVLWAGHCEKASLQMTIVNTAAWFVLSFALIGRFGLMGAAVSLLVSGLIDWLLHQIVIARQLFPVSLVKTAWKPAAAGAIMAAFLSVAGTLPALLTITLASVLYLGALFALAVRAAGGVRRLKTQYLGLWSG